MADMEQLYSDYGTFLFRYLRKLSGDEMLAEELTQETFFRAYMNLKGLRSEEAVSVWLCQIAKNLYLARYKQEKRQVSYESLPEQSAPTDFTEALADRELTAQLLKSLHKLDEPYKEVFLLSVYGQVPLKQISLLFGKSESWARVVYYRAKQKLLEKYKEENP